MHAALVVDIVAAEDGLTSAWLRAKGCCIDVRVVLLLLGIRVMRWVVARVATVHAHVSRMTAAWLQVGHRRRLITVRRVGSIATISAVYTSVCVVVRSTACAIRAGLLTIEAAVLASSTTLLVRESRWLHCWRKEGVCLKEKRKL